MSLVIIILILHYNHVMHAAWYSYVSASMRPHYYSIDHTAGTIRKYGIRSTFYIGIAMVILPYCMGKT